MHIALILRLTLLINTKPMIEKKIRRIVKWVEKV